MCFSPRYSPTTFFWTSRSRLPPPPCPAHCSTRRRSPPRPALFRVGSGVARSSWAGGSCSLPATRSRVEGLHSPTTSSRSSSSPSCSSRWASDATCGKRSRLACLVEPRRGLLELQDFFVDLRGVGSVGLPAHVVLQVRERRAEAFELLVDQATVTQLLGGIRHHQQHAVHDRERLLELPGLHVDVLEIA